MSGVILATAIGSGVTAAGGAAAVGAAAIGAGTTLYGGAKSFSDASKARKRGEAAQRAAEKAIEEARKRVDVNVYEQLSIAKEPYELMREAQLVQGATGLQAGVEGETRGAAATAGRIQMAQAQQQAGIRAQQAQQMDALNKLVADEDARRQQQLAGIAMEEAAGAQLAVRDAEEDRANYIAQGVGTLGSIAEGLATNYAEGNFGQGSRYNPPGLVRTAEEIRSGDLGSEMGYQLADGSVMNPNIDPDAYAAFGGTVPNQFEVAAGNRQSRRARRQMDRQIANRSDMVDFPQPMSRREERQLNRAANDIQRANAQAAIDPAFGGPVIPQDRTFNPNFSPLGTSSRPDQYTPPGQPMSERDVERMLMEQRRLGRQEARQIDRAIRRNPELLNYQAGGMGASGPLDPFDPFGGSGFIPPSSTEATPRQATASVAPAGLGGEPAPAPAPAPERRPVQPRTSVTSGDRETARRRMEANIEATSGLTGAELTKAKESIKVTEGSDGEFTATYTPPTRESRAQVQSAGESTVARDIIDRVASQSNEEVIATPNPTPQEIERVNTEAVEKAAEVGPATEEVVRYATDKVDSSNPLPIAMQWLNVQEPNYRELDPVTGDSVFVQTPTITPEGEQLLTEIWEGVGHGEKTQKEYIKKENAWCAGFVNKVLLDSNLTPLPGKLSKQRADMYMSAKFGENVYTSEDVNRLNLHGNLKKFEEDYGFPKPKGKVKDAKMGDVVIINRPNNKPPTRHVGFFAGFDKDGQIKILGGNQNNEVNVTLFDTSDVIGIRRVNQPDLTDKELEKVSNIVTRQDGATR